MTEKEKLWTLSYLGISKQYSWREVGYGWKTNCHWDRNMDPEQLRLFSKEMYDPQFIHLWKPSPCACLLQCSVHPFSIWLGVSSLYSHSMSRNPRQMEGVLWWLHVLRGPLSGFPLKQGSLGSKGLALPSRPVSGQTIRNPAVKAPSLFLRLV